jgi:folate-binding protein YgfZ
MTKAALLPDRGVVRVAGNDARKLLNGLVTSDLGKLTPQAPCFAALLTPQGKIIADFIVAESGAADGGLFLDCPRALAETLAQRLTFYRLRAKVTIEDLSETVEVLALWDDSADGPSADTTGLCYRDPRLPDLGWRCIVPPEGVEAVVKTSGATLVSADDYDAHRIALGVPQGGADFVYGDTFPHESDMDQLHGVAFDKGCFVGQEVVSRVQHRGTARTRIVPVAFDGASPPAGSAVMAGDKSVGTIGSVAGARGLASLRLDRVEEALAGGTALMANGTPLTLVRPPWARFAFPGEAAAK